MEEAELAFPRVAKIVRNDKRERNSENLNLLYNRDGDQKDKMEILVYSISPIDARVWMVITGEFRREDPAVQDVLVSVALAHEGIWPLATC